jgi:serine/threonine-protein kinase HipA
MQLHSEFAAMRLAAVLGIEVPETSPVPIDAVEGLPDGISRYAASAFAIRRFDRSAQGPVHVEDFAQVFGVFADAKYDNAS